MRWVAGPLVVVSTGCSFLAFDDFTSPNASDAGAVTDAGANANNDGASTTLDGSTNGPGTTDGGTVPSDLVAHWTFDDDTTAPLVAKDVTGHGHDGVVEPGVDRVPGHGGGTAVRFRYVGVATDDFITMKSLDGSAFPVSGTLAMYIKRDRAAGDAVGELFATHEEGRRQIYMRLFSDAVLAGQYGSPSGRYFDSFTGFPSNTWVPVVIAWDTVVKRIRFRTADNQTQELVMTDTSWMPDQQLFRIGSWCGCDVDDVRLYNRAFSKDEIAAVP